MSDPRRKGGRGGGTVLLGEIGDLEGPGRPGEMRDTHSIKWPHVGFGPPLFNAITL